jgi:hypothetical protein
VAQQVLDRDRAQRQRQFERAVALDADLGVGECGDVFGERDR